VTLRAVFLAAAATIILLLMVLLSVRAGAVRMLSSFPRIDARQAAVRLRLEDGLLSLHHHDEPVVHGWLDPKAARSSATLLHSPETGCTLLTLPPGASVSFSLASAGYWYGGPSISRAFWPINSNRISRQPFVSNDMLANREGLGSLLEASWLTSTGATVRVVASEAEPEPEFEMSMNTRCGRDVAADDNGAGDRSGGDLPPHRPSALLCLWASETAPMTIELSASSDVLHAQRGLITRLRAHAVALTRRASADVQAHPAAPLALPSSPHPTDDSALPSSPMALDALAHPSSPHPSAASPHSSSPAALDALSVVRAPIWSTWARYKMGVTEQLVLAFANEVRCAHLPPSLPLDALHAHSPSRSVDWCSPPPSGISPTPPLLLPLTSLQIAAREFPRSVMEVDDRWSSAYGEFSFDPLKFPQPRRMVEQLHALGFRVTLWVIPFAEPSAPAHAEGARLGHWVKDESGQPLAVRWWQGVGALLDVSSPAAVDWFEGRLRKLMAETGVDGFKFDAGESIFLPSGEGRNAYAAQWARLAGRFGGGSEVRAAHASQDAPVWLREFDKDSRWDVHNGLASLITSALHQAVLGYPMVLPDMIGGNAYAEQVDTVAQPVPGDGAPADAPAPPPPTISSLSGDLFFYGARPDRELFIRWCFANALLPAVQFSIAPWQYDEDATAACAKAMRIRAERLPTIEALVERAAATGEPIVRPLWWHDPLDPTCHAIADQFMLGDAVMVAPVLQPGLAARPIYIPAGSWRSELSLVYHGPTWLLQHSAPLDALPVFDLLLDQERG
jgi:hypothetical protein